MSDLIDDPQKTILPFRLAEELESGLVVVHTDNPNSQEMRAEQT